MLPLVHADTRQSLHAFIEWGIAEGVFAHSIGGLVTVEMDQDQNIQRFIELGKELQPKVDEFEEAVAAGN